MKVGVGIGIRDRNGYVKWGEEAGRGKMWVLGCCWSTIKGSRIRDGSKKYGEMRVTGRGEHTVRTVRKRKRRGMRSR